MGDVITCKTFEKIGPVLTNNVVGVDFIYPKSKISDNDRLFLF